MNLVGVFEQAASPTVRDALATAPGLEEALAKLFQAGAARFPDIQISASDFVRFAARHLPAETRTPTDFEELSAAELYLVCAYGRGDRTAQNELERGYMGKVRRALLGLAVPEAICADIEQDLRKQLIEMQDPGIQRKGYSGRSTLGGWLCLSGIRAARMQHRRHSHEQSLEQADAELLPTDVGDPALALMIKRYKQELRIAFSRAVVSLSVRERNLLRYHFLDQLTIDQIALFYRVHRATAARWIRSTQDELCSRTRAYFLALVPSDPASLPNIMALLQSQVSLSLMQILTPTPEPEHSTHR